MTLRRRQLSKILLAVVIVCAANTGSNVFLFHSVHAGIFGNGGGRRSNGGKLPPQRRGTNFSPPPPPGGQIQRRVQMSSSVDTRHDATTTLRPPPPLPSNVIPIGNLHVTNATSPIGNLQRPIPPPPVLSMPTEMLGSTVLHTQQDAGFRMSTQQPLTQMKPSEEAVLMNEQHQLYFMHRDLDAAFQREQALLNELHNLTSSMAGLQRREELHIHQLDVLTERVMDVETSAARDRNQLVEYRANCTELMQQLTMQSDQLEEWRNKCEELVELRELDEEKIRELKEKVKVATHEAEELAEMIERHRIHSEGEGLSKTNKKKKHGFFAWLFGFNTPEDDVEYKQMEESARSTLLTALRIERNSVSELEAAVTTLQENNLAVNEQIQSRDQIIDELNSRVAVFEEDKLVLKAALRQLQKEMKDEAPKSQKLVDDLVAARSEVERLSTEIKNLVRSHKKEVTDLQKLIRRKEEEAHAIEANMTAIGTYVDKLEERLADFTVIKRDVEKREASYSKVEQKIKDSETEKWKLQNRVSELEKEHTELKTLLNELVQERSKLQVETTKLESQRETLQQDVQELRKAYAQLENDSKILRNTSEMWEKRCKTVEENLNATLALKELMIEKLNVSESEKVQLQRQVDEAVSQKQIVASLQENVEGKRVLENRLMELEAERQTLSETHNAIFDEMKRALDEQKKEVARSKEEQRRAIKEAQQAIDMAATAEIKRLETEAAAVKAIKESETKLLLSQQAAAIAIHKSEAQRHEAEESAAKLAAEMKARRFAAEAAVTISSGKVEVNRTSTQFGEKSHEKCSDDSGSEGTFSAEKIPALPIIAPPHSMDSSDSMRHRDSVLPHIQPNTAPKRQFGSGDVKPQRTKSQHNETNPIDSTPIKSRKIFLRKFRKAFAKTTGVHGLFTPPSNPRPRTKKSIKKTLRVATAQRTPTLTANAVRDACKTRKRVPLGKIRNLFAKPTNIQDLLPASSQSHHIKGNASLSTATDVSSSQTKGTRPTLDGLQTHNVPILDKK